MTTTEHAASAPAAAPARLLVEPDLRYRPDIDGLRAVAVVAVILFHAELALFEGGYVGVDVFFVISGYLITQRVVASVETGRFSARDFYRRRVRRLLPAASSTILVTLAAGLVLLPPYRFQGLGLSALAASTSWSNVLFWTEAGYWEAEALTKPLLHTWSLSVEEQFYLVWPALLLLLVSRLGRRAIAVVVGLGIVSVVVTTLATPTSPTAAFYLMPYRGYEFLLGAGCVWLDRRPWPTTGGALAVRRLLLLGGLGAVLYAVLAFDATTVFPGATALVPTVGAVAVILAREPAGLTGLLGSRAAQHVGRTSYSLYLVHWPLLVFAQELTGGLAPEVLGVLLPASLVLAELQYRHVEERFRIRSGGAAGPGRPPRAWPVLVTAAGAAALGGGLALLGPMLVAATAVEETEVVVDDEGEEQVVALTPVVSIAAQPLEVVNEDRNEAATALCQDQVVPGVVCGSLPDDGAAASGPVVLVIGDSQSPDGLNALSEALPDATFLLSQQNACPVLVDLEDVDHRASDCAAVNEQRLAAVGELADDLDLVVLSMRLQPDRLAALGPTLEQLTALVDEVAVLGVGPEYERPAWEVVLDFRSREGLDLALTRELREGRFALDDEVAEVVETAGATYLPRLDLLCPAERCQALVPDVDALVLHDQTHLTLPGAELVGRDLARETDLGG